MAFVINMDDVLAQTPIFFFCAKAKVQIADFLQPLIQQPGFQCFVNRGFWLGDKN